jgi:hypothetical protein
MRQIKRRIIVSVTILNRETLSRRLPVAALLAAFVSIALFFASERSLEILTPPEPRTFTYALPGSATFAKEIGRTPDIALRSYDELERRVEDEIFATFSLYSEKRRGFARVRYFGRGTDGLWYTTLLKIPLDPLRHYETWDDCRPENNALRCHSRPDTRAIENSTYAWYCLRVLGCVVLPLFLFFKLRRRPDE